MANENEKVTPASGTVETGRREFVKTSAKVAVTAPAVAVLLTGMSKPAQASISEYQARANHILDDYTTGNNREDIDAFTGSNENVWGHPQLDDHI